MKFEISQTDYQLFVSVLTLLREKGGYNSSLTRQELVIHSGIGDNLMSRKILNSYKLEKILKERIQ